MFLKHQLGQLSPPPWLTRLSNLPFGAVKGTSCSEQHFSLSQDMYTVAEEVSNIPVLSFSLMNLDWVCIKDFENLLFLSLNLVTICFTIVATAHGNGIKI